LSEVARIIKRTQQMYEERNKLFEATGLGDYTYSDEEIEKFIAEAIEKEINNRINKVVKDSGL
jgi:hypothetical protein|tara:strand:+ start:38 stop:226 length:189 start_codon:yes stop_codon:yes gene_type:complete